MPGAGWRERLVRRTETTLTVEQFKPQKLLDLDAGSIAQIWPVIDWQEAMGFS